MTDASLKKNRIRELLAQHRLEESRALCERTLAISPNDADVWLLGAIIHGLLEQPRQTEQFAREAIRLRPNFPEAHNSLGLALRLQGRTADAVTVLQEAIRLKPGYADAFYNLGVTLHSLGRLTEAATNFQRVIALRPRDTEALNDLGNVLQQLNRHTEAVDCFKRALALKPTFALAHFNLGNALVDLGNMSEGIHHYRKAVEIDPAFTDAYYNLGDALRISGQLREAITYYRAAIRFKPDHANAHFNLSSVYLLLGEFEMGWNEYAWHWQRHTSPRRPLNATTWDGSNLQKRNVFLHAEQGLGDELFFLRFLPWLKRRGAGRITYRPGRKIASLLARVAVIDRLAEPDEFPAADDLVFSVGDLPRLLKMNHIEEIPPRIGLTPCAESLSNLQIQLASYGHRRCVGVTWRAGTLKKENALYKETQLELMAKALRPINASVVVLQRHPAPGEVEAFARALGRPVHDLSALNDDLEQMLALLSLIDEYVGVSNTNMHLRAGVGKTARVLVPAPPEWRWMAEGKESPWFPGFRVYRQGYDGGWGEAYDELTSDLKVSLSEKP